MICDNGIESEHHKIKRSRTLPVVPNKNHRSCSLPKISDRNISRRKSEIKQNVMTKVNKSLSQSMNTLARQGIIKEDNVEIPVVVDEVTKWITGVNKSTTCQDIIRAILQREAGSFQVRLELDYLIKFRNTKLLMIMCFFAHC